MNDFKGHVENSCAICLESIDDSPCVLECNHAFHSRCIIQSALHDQSGSSDPRCPTCRRQIAKSVKPEQRAVVEISMGDVDSAIEREFSQMRRNQINYDSRRRRIIKRRFDLQDQQSLLRQTMSELRKLDEALHKKWSIESKELWMGDKFKQLKNERTCLLRKIRRHKRYIDNVVIDALGTRPELDFDNEERNTETIARAIVRLGAERISAHEADEL